MNIKRDIIDKLVEWKHSKTHKPMLLMGARQTGKSWVTMSLISTLAKLSNWEPFSTRPKSQSVY